MVNTLSLEELSTIFSLSIGLGIFGMLYCTSVGKDIRLLEKEDKTSAKRLNKDFPFISYKECYHLIKSEVDPSEFRNYIYQIMNL